MQQLSPITIVCPACKVGQLAQPQIATHAINFGDAGIAVGEPYIICRFGVCKHVIQGNEYAEVTATSIKNPADMRRALTNQ